MTANLKVIELRGRGSALGQAHGEALRDLIRAHVRAFNEIHREALGTIADRASLVELSLKNALIIKRFSPFHFDELDGISKGAAVPFNDILLINTFLELEDLLAPDLAKILLPPKMATLAMESDSSPAPASAIRSPMSSTSFNIKPRATSSNLPLIGQTWDLDERLSPFGAVLKITGPDRRRIMVHTLAGVLGLCGLNDYGLALAANKLVAADPGPGLIAPVLVRKSLEQARIGDALGVLALAPRASSMAWQMSSGDGPAFCLETTRKLASDIYFRYSQAHANHFLDPSLAKEEALGWPAHGGTFVRNQVAQERLDDFRGRVDTELLKALCQDHINNPLGICAHASVAEPFLSSLSTASAIVMEPSAAIMHISGPHPCQNFFETLSL